MITIPTTDVVVPGWIQSRRGVLRERSRPAELNGYCFGSSRFHLTFVLATGHSTVQEVA